MTLLGLTSSSIEEDFLEQHWVLTETELPLLTSPVEKFEKTFSFAVIFL